MGNLVVAIASPSKVSVEWAIRLAHLQFPPNAIVTTLWTKVTPLHESRSHLIRSAQALPTFSESLIFLLSPDTLIPVDALAKLWKQLEEHPEWDAISGTCDSGEMGDALIFHGREFLPGCALIRASVFDKISPPWFPEQDREFGETLERAGVKYSIHAGVVCELEARKDETCLTPK
jgi:hypothetical protein